MLQIVHEWSSRPANLCSLQSPNFATASEANQWNVEDGFV
jgi:hypothetical protein